MPLRLKSRIVNAEGSMGRSMCFDPSLRGGVLYAAIFSAILGAGNADAQATSAHLTGVVVTETGDPLPDVTLSIGRSDATTKSDGAGRFELPAVPWGQVRLHARALGFAPKDTVMSLQSGTSYAVRLQLRRFVAQLDTVQVRATLEYGKPARYQHTGKLDDFYERRARRPGTYFTREDIERSPATKVSELISSVGGMTLAYRLSPKGLEPHLKVARCSNTSGTLNNRGYAWFAVYVDGQRLNQLYALDFLSTLSTLEIETMEVYRGVTQLPLEAIGNACAAVFITTRFTSGSVLGTK